MDYFKAHCKQIVFCNPIIALMILTNCKLSSLYHCISDDLKSVRRRVMSKWLSWLCSATPRNRPGGGFSKEDNETRTIGRLRKRGQDLALGIMQGWGIWVWGEEGPIRCKKGPCWKDVCAGKVVEVVLQNWSWVFWGAGARLVLVCGFFICCFFK